MGSLGVPESEFLGSRLVLCVDILRCVRAYANILYMPSLDFHDTG